MKRPLLDPRTPEELREQLHDLARSYTPEWRYEGTENDPGAALAELFLEMYGQSVDRFNALPDKLFIEFLNMLGFKEPAPTPASGTVCFEAQDNTDEPFTVPSGTQLFTPDEEGENIVYETERTIQVTPAVIGDIFFVDTERDSISRLDLSERPQSFFEPSGEELQSHRFMAAENDVLRLDCPACVELNIRPRSGLPEDAAKALARMDLKWAFLNGGTWRQFDAVRVENGALILEKNSGLSPEADEEGHTVIRCTGHPDSEVFISEMTLSSSPLSPCPAQAVYGGDLPIPLPEGGRCFGRRPSVYDMMFIRCDTVLSKRGAEAHLRLELAFLVDEPEQPAQERYDYSRHVINKQAVAERKPDDVAVTEVIWEYFNGIGWKHLRVSGDRNPFSGKREGTLELTFTVPDDIDETEINADIGYFIRARIVDVSNQYSNLQRWIVPFLKGASLKWQYTGARRPQWCYSENNGRIHVLEEADRSRQIMFPALVPMNEERSAMYFRFDRSPHAMPLSLRFQVQGRAHLNGQLLWEYWNGKAFEPVRTVDRTERLEHSGEIFLFLPEPIPESEQLGVKGCWLRLSRSADEKGAMPTVVSVKVNAVSALQRQREEDQLFDTEIYEAGKRIRLLNMPVQTCRVWVDERSVLSDDAIALIEREAPERVRKEWDGHMLVRCWIEWEKIDDIALAWPDERVYTLDPFIGEIAFGDGRRGRVPPSGDHNILVEYSSGGGERGNVPAGAIKSLLTAMPQISDVVNLTAMSGGTGRLLRDEIHERGSRFLRSRGRASSCGDYEELVRDNFPQVNHVRCFSERNERGERAQGHIAVVIAGYGAGGEGTEELCGRVYRFLSERCSCCLVAENRLHVSPATVLTINTSVTVETERPELAAETQQSIVKRLEALIGQTWRNRPIGEQIRLSEIWSVVRDTPNVRVIKRILIEASYDQDGQQKLAALEADSEFPYGVAESGMHLVRLS